MKQYMLNIPYPIGPDLLRDAYFANEANGKAVSITVDTTPPYVSIGCPETGHGYNVRKDWLEEIKQSPPKVRDAELLIAKSNYQTCGTERRISYSDGGIKRLMNDARDNYRLERNLELALLFEEIENMINCNDNDLSYWIEIFGHVLENLKPL